MKHILCSLLIVFATMVASGDVCAQNGGVGVRVIVIDAGHGGAFPGAIYGKVKEKDLNLKVALKLGALIEKELPDVKVVYTRKSDIALGKSLNEDLTARANIANKAEGDFFISIHRNSFPTDNQVSGVESLVYDLSGLKYEMAQEINEQLEAIGFVNLGVKARPNLIVLKRTQMPAVLIEVGFINSDIDNQLFDQNFEAIAQSVANGIIETLSEGTDIIEGNYSVQVGAFRNQNYARTLQEELIEMDFPARIERREGFYRVRVGSYRELNEAIRMEQRLKRAGYQTVIVT